MILVLLGSAFFVSVAHADSYMGIAHGYITQDIGIQAQNDTPLDDLCATGQCTYRGGDGSKVQSDHVAGFFGGWRRGPWSMELGYTDLGTWPLTDYATASTSVYVCDSADELVEMARSHPYAGGVSGFPRGHDDRQARLELALRACWQSGLTEVLAHVTPEKI